MLLVSMCRGMPFSVHALIVVKNKSKCGLSWSVLFSTKSTYCDKKTNGNVVYHGLYSYRPRVHIVTLFPNNLTIFCTVSAC